MDNHQLPIIHNLNWKAFAESFLPHIEEGIAALDTHGRILYCNTAFVEVCGQPAAQLQDKLLGEILEEADNRNAWFYHQFSDKEILYKNQPCAVKIIPLFTQAHEHTGSTVVLKKNAQQHIDRSDLTEQEPASIYHQLLEEIEGKKGLKAQLQYKERFINKIAYVLPSMITLYNVHSGRYLYVNGALEQLSGYKHAAFFQKGIEFFISLIHPEDLPGLLSKNNEAIQRAKGRQADYTSEIVEFEYRIRHSNGSWRWIHTSGTVFDRTQEGEVAHILTVSIDITTRKETEHFVERINSSTPNLLYIFDIIRNKNLYANQKMCELLGYTQQQMQDMGESFFEQVVHPDDGKRIAYNARVISTLADGELFEHEIRLKDTTGSWRWIACREVIFKRDDQGQVIQILGTAQDVTEKKTAHEKLKESQHFTKQVADATPDIIYVYDLVQKRSVYINKEIYNKLGYTPEQFYALGATATKTITHPDDLASRLAHFEKIQYLADGEILELEYRVRTREGEWIWVHTRDAVFKRTPEGIPCQLIGVSQDITHIKLAQEKLAESQLFIQQINDTTPDHLYVFDLLQMRVVYINKEITNTLGYTPEDLYSIGENIIARLMHPDDIEPVTRHLQQFSQAHSKEVREIEYRLKDVQGNWRWIFSRETVFKCTPQGIPYQIVGISRDITEKKLADEELRYKSQLIENMLENFPIVLTKVSKEGLVQEAVGSGLRSIGLAGNDKNEYQSLVQNQQAKPYISEVLQGGKASFQQEILYKNEKTYFQNFYIFDPARECANGFIIDISEQKRTEEKLKASETQLLKLNEELEYRVEERTIKLAKSEQRYRSLIWATTSIVWTANRAGEMVEENKLWEQFTGQTYEQYQGLGWMQSLHPDDQLANSAIWQKAIEEKTPAISEYRLLHKSGQYRYMSVRAVPIINSDGHIQEWIGTCTDIHDRKLAEEALRKSEQRYEIAASVTHDAIWDWDLLTNELTYTEGYYTLFGFDKHETKGTIEEWYSRIHPDDVQRVLTGIQQCISSNESFWKDEYRHLCKNGSYAFVFDRGYIQYDISAKPVRMVGAMADITERKQAEDALRQNEEQLRLITDALPVLISYIDAGECYRFNNKAYEDWFKKPRADVYGKHIREVVGPDAYHQLKNYIEQALQGKEVSFETTLFYQEIGMRAIHANYIPHLLNGRTEGFYVLVQDITEQKNAQQNLALSEERFRLVSRATNDVIWDWNLINDHVWWNEGLRILFGYKPEEIEEGPESWYGRIHPEDINRVVSGVNRVIEVGGEQWSGEYRFRKADGSYAFVLDRGYILHNEEGKSIRMIGSMIDITYIKEAQEALAQQAQELKQSNADLEQFAYISSHDLQEPLNTAASFAKLLAKKYSGHLDADAQEFISFIVDATDRMKLLIKSLLSYSKINASGKLQEPTDVNQVIKQTQENLKTSILESGAEIIVQPMPVIYANSQQMVQLFQNLLSNAIKFRRKQPLQITISVNEGENHYLFSVTDNGIGMDMKYTSKIFQVFQRLHSRDQYEGAGIGLATCKRIVERHGGLIWVESQPDQGSTFYFTIRK